MRFYEYYSIHRKNIATGDIIRAIRDCAVVYWYYDFEDEKSFIVVNKYLHTIKVYVTFNDEKPIATFNALSRDSFHKAWRVAKMWKAFI